MLGADLILDATLLPAMGVALLAGVLSFLSPCVLPIVPPYLALMGGVSVQELGEARTARRRALIAAAFFVLGLSTVFLFLGLLFGRGAAVPAVPGLVHHDRGPDDHGVRRAFLGVIRLPFLMREARMDAGTEVVRRWGLCSGIGLRLWLDTLLGPILGAILGLAASEADLARGTTLLAIYALGLGIPFLLVAAFFPRMAG